MAQSEGSQPNKTWATNAVTAFAIAVVSGLLVWWLTKPPQQSGKPVYTIDEIGQFSSKRGNHHFFKIKLSNEGRSTSNGISLLIEPNDPNAVLSESSVTKSKTNPNIKMFEYSGNRLNSQVISLKPSEYVIYWISYKSKNGIKIDVDATYEDGIVEEFKEYSLKDKIKDSPVLIFLLLIAYVAASFGIQKLVSAHFKKRRDEYSKNYAYDHEAINNSSFILLHSGNSNDAQNLLWEALRQGNGSPYELANYALAITANGRIQDGKALLRTIKKWSKIDHEKSVIDFNISVADLIAGDASAYDRLKLQCNESEEIKRYFENSALISELTRSMKIGHYGGDLINTTTFVKPDGDVT